MLTGNILEVTFVRFWSFLLKELSSGLLSNEQFPYCDTIYSSKRGRSSSCRPCDPCPTIGDQIPAQAARALRGLQGSLMHACQHLRDGADVEALESARQRKAWPRVDRGLDQGSRRPRGLLRGCGQCRACRWPGPRQDPCGTYHKAAYHIHFHCKINSNRSVVAQVILLEMTSCKFHVRGRPATESCHGAVGRHKPFRKNVKE